MTSRGIDRMGDGALFFLIHTHPIFLKTKLYLVVPLNAHLLQPTGYTHSLKWPTGNSHSLNVANWQHIYTKLTDPNTVQGHLQAQNLGDMEGAF